MRLTDVHLNRPLVVAVVVAVAIGLPIFLTGAFTEQLRSDLGVSAGTVGLAVGGAFLVGGLLSAPSGRLADRVGPSRTLLAATVIAGVASAGIPALASQGTLIPLLFLAGAGAALGDASINAHLTSAIRREDRSMAFGVSKAAFPGAALVAGFAIPAVAGPLGWRWAYILSVGTAFAASLLVRSYQLSTRTSTVAPKQTHESAFLTGRLLLVALGAFLGTAAAVGATTFLVAAAVESGAPLGGAGLILSAGSAVAIFFRLFLGWRVRNSPPRAIRWVAAILAVGSAGYLALWATPWPWFAIAAPLVVGTSWGWIGLLSFGVASGNPERPGSVTGVMGSAAFLGAFAGPVAFGFVAETGSFARGWLFAAAAAGMAAFAIFASQFSEKPLHRDPESNHR